MRAAVVLFLLYTPFLVQGFSVLTIAGNFSGYADGVGTNSLFYQPRGLSFDSEGNLVVTDTFNHRIRKISLSDLTVTTFSGTGLAASTDGATPSYNGPIGITAPDVYGTFWITDWYGSKIRRLSSTGVATTIAGTGALGWANGPGINATFNRPRYIIYDNSTGNLTLTDHDNNLVRRITPAGIVSTFGTATNPLTGITMDTSSNIYVVSRSNPQVTRFSKTGVATIFAGSGIAGYLDAAPANAQFTTPFGISLDQFGTAYLADSGNNMIRQIPTSGNVTTVAGGLTSGFANGLGPDARFFFPEGVLADNRGNIYVADTYNHRIRMIVPCDGGYFVQNASCQNCTAGTYSLFAQFGSSSCIPCGGGNVSRSGSATCSSSCGPGFITVGAACLPIVSTTLIATTSTATRVTSVASTTTTSMVTPLITIRTSSVVISASYLDATSNPTSTGFGIEPTGMSSQPISQPTTASAVPSTDVSIPDDPFSSFDSNIVIYASAASGGAALLGVSAFFVYRQRRNKRPMAKLTVIAPTNFQSVGITQFSGNSYLGGRHASPYALNSGLMYKPTNGMQTTGGPQFGQSMSKAGWSGPPFGVGGFYPEQGTAIGNMSATAQFMQFPNLHNPSSFNRPPSYVGTMNLGGTHGTQNPSTYGMPATEQPHNYGNTITVVPKSLMQFQLRDMYDAH